MVKPYRYIRLWCQFMHSGNDHMHDQIDAARRENAPDDALFKYRDSNKWAVFSDIPDHNPFRDYVELANKSKD